MHTWKPDTHAVSSDGRRERQGVMAVSVASSKSPTMPERICAAVVDAIDGHPAASPRERSPLDRSVRCCSHVQAQPAPTGLATPVAEPPR